MARKTEKGGKFRNVHCRTWNMARKLKIMENEKHPLDDRIFTAMLHGAAALTDGSTYLREQFAHMDTAAFYDLQSLECLPQQVEELLGEPQRLYEMACRGKAVAKQLHRWKNRAEILKGYV